MTKNPNVVDQYVGGRVKNRRTSLRLSQSKLAAALGISFQQVQKYEKGSNRIGASRLQQIAKFLQTTPSFFFDGAPVSDPGAAVGFAEEAPPPQALEDFLSSPEGRLLAESFQSLTDPQVRKRVVDLVIAIAQAFSRREAQTHRSVPAELPD